STSHAMTSTAAFGPLRPSINFSYGSLSINFRRRSRNREHFLLADFPRMSYISHSLALRGAPSGGVLRAERGAAPAGWARNPALGRPRDPPAGHYEPAARSSLMRAGAPVQ